MTITNKARKVIVTGQPDWSGRLERLTHEGGYKLKHYVRRAGYISRLTADQPALIVADADSAARSFWITTPRTSPATRRIPIVAVGVDDAGRSAALGAGADHALAPNELEGRLPEILSGLGFDPQEAETLAGQCGDPLPAEAIEAIRKFNAGEFYKQHDLLEALWMKEGGPVRSLYQGILQVGIAYYQVTRGNRRGAVKMLHRARQWLAALPDACRGVDVAKLRQDADRVLAELEGMRDEDIGQFERKLLRPVKVSEK